jgi:hypothetical protein
MSVLEEAASSLSRVQQFDPSKLIRRDELGSEMSFEPAEPLAQKVIDLFRQIPVDHLKGLPDNLLQLIKNEADSFFNLVTQVLEFKSSMNNATAQREALISQLGGCYTGYFSNLHNIISYISSQQRDYGALEREARAKIQQATDRADELRSALESHEVEAKRVLEEVKKVAAEQGVSQQAFYFSEESKSHSKEVAKWESRIILLAVIAVAYLGLALFIHKIPYLTPQNTYEAVQLGISKSLIFAVLAYLLILCGRNYLSHEHNAIVNRHRQNALLTFKALADAAAASESRDIVLTHASACIFSPQETGYTKGVQQTNVSGLVESIPRMIQGTTHSN